MAYNSNVARPNKDKCRTRLIESMNHSKVALFLPSSGLLCIREALNKGKINRNTKIIAIEQDKKIVKVIKKFLKENFNEFYIHPYKVETLDLNEVTQTFGKIDSAFFDFCGPLSDSIAYWLMNQTKNAFTMNAKIGFTFSLGRRTDSILLQAEDNPTLLLWINKITGFKDNKKNLEYKASFPTLSVLAYFMGDSFKIIHREEYQDTRSPMLFIEMKKNGNHTDYETHELITESSFDVNVPASVYDTNLKDGIWSKNLIVNKLNVLEPIIKAFNSANTPQKWAGAKRMVTLYTQKRSEQTGKHKDSFMPAVKAVLKRNGIHWK